MKDEQTTDREVAELGWGPTLRLSTLVLVRGLARRLTRGPQKRLRGAILAAVTIAGAALVGCAKGHGWL